jgi:hypothetical protein
MTVREPWFERVESVHERTGFRMRVVTHAHRCLCTTCFGERLEQQKAGVEL